MSANVSDMKKLIWHSLDAYSTWWSPYNVSDIADRLLMANAAPLCQFYDTGDQLERDVTFDLLLCLHSDRYFDAYKKVLNFSKFSYRVYDFLDDAYVEAAKHPEILDRIEQLFEFFLEKDNSPKDHVLLAVFNDHPRYHQRIQTELNRVGHDQFNQSLWTQYGSASWPIVLSWKAPEYSCRSLSDMKVSHYAKLYEIYLEFMTHSDLNKMIISNYQYSAHTGSFWSQVIDLDQMVKTAGYASIDELFMGQTTGSRDGIQKDAQRLALTRALNCQATMQRLSQLTPEQGQMVRKCNILPKDIVHQLGWSTAKEKRQDIESDMGL